MRYAVIIAGGSGTRLWPMSRAALPKQLIPFVGGRSLLEIAVARLEGLCRRSNASFGRPGACRGHRAGRAAAWARPIPRRAVRARYAERCRA